MRSDYDPALETLFVPFVTDRLEWPAGGALFLRARDGMPLHERRWPGLVCEQTFKPDADALARAGFEVSSHVEDRRFPLVLILPPRQRDEARALMARAVSMLEAGGRVVAAAANTEGARSAESDLQQLVGSVETISKNKCRVFWSAASHEANTALVQQWRELDAVQPIEDGRFVSRPGIFAWDRIDAASALLAENLPADLHGDAADLGCGFGYLSVELLARAPGIRRLDLYEAEGRALDLAKRNVQQTNTGTELHFEWHDITSGLPRKYDVIITNPPFHAHASRDRPDIGRRFVRVAAEALKPGGRLWLVANRHLPYEEVLDRNFGDVRIVTQQSGFKIIEAAKTGSRR